MKVLKQGTPPSKVFYQGRCPNCETEVEFMGFEAKFDRAPEGGVLAWYPCPACRARINVPTSDVNMTLAQRDKKPRR